MKTTINAVIAIASIFFITTGCGNNSSSTNEPASDTLKSPESSTSTAKPDNVNSGDTFTSRLETIDTSNRYPSGKLTSPMDTMMNKITTTKMTGNFDIDYAILMIDHSQGVAGMSDFEVKNGQDEKLKTIARSIMNDENAETTKLKEFLKNYKLAQSKQGADELSKATTGLTNKIKSITASGNTDKEYASMIVEHLQYDVDLGSKLQTKGTSEELKKIATTAKDAQLKYIRDLKTWLNANK